MSAVGTNFWTTLPLGRDVQVLATDANGLGALNKPVGVLSHPNTRGEEKKSLLDARYESDGEFYHWEGTAGGVKLWLLNRLDSATSGVILVSASETLAKAVRLHFRQKRVHKIYQALVFGCPNVTEQVWRDRLAVAKRAGKIRTATAGHIPAECRMKVVRQARSTTPPRTLLRLEPVTGRSHQLRVQCAKRNLPIIGDQTYGDFARNREFAKATGEKRLFLHSLETEFDYEYLGRRHHFAAKAPLPPEFTAML